MVFPRLFVVDPAAIVLRFGPAVLRGVAAVRATRCGVARPVRGPWQLLGVSPPGLVELWLIRPLLPGRAGSGRMAP